MRSTYCLILPKSCWDSKFDRCSAVFRTAGVPRLFAVSPFYLERCKQVESGTATVPEISRETGISENTLYTCMKRYRENRDMPFVESGHVLPENEELVRLRREIKDLQEENEIRRFHGGEKSACIGLLQFENDRNYAHRQTQPLSYTFPFSKGKQITAPHIFRAPFDNRKVTICDLIHLIYPFDFMACFRF